MNSCLWIFRFALSAMDMEQRDYDSRTALHVAAAEGNAWTTLTVFQVLILLKTKIFFCVYLGVLGHVEVVKFLLEACKVNPFPKDRWVFTLPSNIIDNTVWIHKIVVLSCSYMWIHQGAFVIVVSYKGNTQNLDFCVTSNSVSKSEWYLTQKIQVGCISPYEEDNSLDLKRWSELCSHGTNYTG